MVERYSVSPWAVHWMRPVSYGKIKTISCSKSLSVKKSEYIMEEFLRQQYRNQSINQPINLLINYMIKRIIKPLLNRQAE
jgi:hypothetical protein